MQRMEDITSHVSFPSFCVPADTIIDKSTALEFLDSAINEGKLDKNEKEKQRMIIEHTEVEKRHIVLRKEAVRTAESLSASDCHSIYRKGLYLALEAARSALITSGISAKEIDCVAVYSCTGVLMPSACIFLFAQLGLRKDVDTLAVTQSGCAAGVASLQHADTYVRAYRDRAVLIVNFEVCSSMYHGEFDRSSLVCASLFGDAAGSVVVFGVDHPFKHRTVTCFGTICKKEYVLDSTEEWMYYDVSEKGLHFRLDKSVRESMPFLKKDILEFAASSGVDIHNRNLLFLVHTGGPKILKQLLRELYGDENLQGPNFYRVRASYEVLRNFGNVAGVTIFASMRMASVMLAKEGVHEPRPCIGLACGPGMKYHLIFGYLYPSPLPSSGTNQSSLDPSHFRVILKPMIAPKAVDYDVIILGAGPTGLCLSILLSSFGLSVALVERHSDIYPYPRADHIDAATLRILERACPGIATYLIKNRFLRGCGEKQVVYPLHQSDANEHQHRIYSTIEIQKAQYSDDGFEPTLFFDPVALESELRRYIQENSNIATFYGWNVLGIDEDKAILQYQDTTFIQYQISSKCIVGCDGTKSLVRQSIKHGNDKSFSMSKVCILQADYLLPPGSLPADYGVPNIVTQTCIRSQCIEESEVRHMAIVPALTADNRLRLVIQTLPRDKVISDSEDAITVKSDAAIQRLMLTIIGEVFPGLDERLLLSLERCVAYTVGPFVSANWFEAESYKGFGEEAESATSLRVIAGDAAHAMLPFLGQGLCSGLRDADALSWRLYYFIKGVASVKVFGHYTEERIQHVTKIMKASTAVHDHVRQVAKGTADIQDAFYNRKMSLTFMTLVPAMPGTTTNLKWVGQLFPRYQKRDGTWIGVARTLSDHSIESSVHLFSPLFIVYTRLYKEETAPFSHKFVSVKFVDIEDVQKTQETEHSRQRLLEMFHDASAILVRPDDRIIYSWADHEPIRHETLETAINLYLGI